MKETVSAYTDSLDCVHCGLCLEVCPTYTELGLETDSPRGRIYLMRALAEGQIEDPSSIRHHLDRCLGCRACETACPSGVHYGRIIETVRSELEERQPTRGFSVWLRRLLLKQVVSHQGRLRIAFRLGAVAEAIGLRSLATALGILPRSTMELVPRIPPAAARAPLPEGFAPKEPRRGKVQLFTGCVMEQLFGEINRGTAELLAANGFEVEVPPTQGCCGALLAHDAQARAAHPLAERNLAAFGDSDLPIVVNSAGCGAALREYGDWLGTEAARTFSARCVDITEFLHRVGLREEPAAFPRRVAYDAPCHLCHGQGVHEQPLSLLEQVPGIELVQHPGREDCCGSAGIYNLLHPDLAEPIGERKAREIDASGAEVVVSGNPGCMLQIEAHLRRIGSKVEVRHPVELLQPAGAEPTERSQR